MLTMNNVLSNISACFSGRLTRRSNKYSSPSSTKTKTKSLLRKNYSREYAASSVCAASTDNISIKKKQRFASLKKRASAPISPNTFVRRKSFVTNDSLVKTLKRDSYVRRRFESYADHQHASENVAFMKEIIQWKTDTPGNLQEAQRICADFIHEESPLQINISWSARTSIETKIATYIETVPVTIFDEAAREISNMMIDGGIWGSFVWKGGCDNIEYYEERKPSSTQMTVN